MTMIFVAYMHKTQEGRSHLRVKQPPAPRDRVDDLKARLNRVGSPAVWHSRTWEWDYPLTPSAVMALQQVSEDLSIPIEWSEDLREYAHYYVSLDQYEEQVRKQIEKTIRDKASLSPYPTNTKGDSEKPFHHQQVSFYWAYYTSGLLLAHDPGLGKTRSAVDAAGGWYRSHIIRTMSQVWRPESRAANPARDKTSPPRGCWGVSGGILVVCPRVMIRTWGIEMSMWQNMTALEITGSRKRKIERLGTIAHAHIVNYESLPLVVSVLNQYDAVIVDESHRCANHTDQMLNVLDLAMKARRKLLLTGTPTSNNLEAVFYQMLITDGGRSLGSNKTRFMSEFFDSETVNKGHSKYTPKSGAVEAVASRMSRCTYFLKKDEVLDLPEKTHTPLYLPMTEDQAKYYRQVKQEAVSFIQDQTVTVEMAIQRMMKLAQICQGFVISDQGELRHFNDTKNIALTEMILGNYSGHKLVVWCRFTFEIDRLCQMLHSNGIPHVRYDGKTKQIDRDRGIEVWQHDPSVRVFVGQLQMGIGITLHAATCAVPCCNAAYLALDFSYVNWIQSMDRIHRIGQRWPVSYIYLLTEDGIDRRIYQALKAKEETATAVHRYGKEFYLSMLTDDTPHLAMVD